MKEYDIRPKDLYNEFMSIVYREVPERFANVYLEETDCPACTKKHYRKVFNKLGFDYCECQQCHTIFVNPMPDQESLEGYYRDSKAVKFFAEKLYEKTKEVRREKLFRPRVELIKELIKKLDFSNCFVLDIGGGSGLLADELAKENIECRVIEPSYKLAQICRSKNITTYNTFFEQFDLGGLDNSKAIILTSFELVEHLRKPGDFFSHAYKGMKKGNILFFTTLSSTGFDLRVLWDKSNSFLPPLHLVFFNPKSIRILLEKIGFEIIDISTPGKLDWDIVEGMIKTEEVSIGKFWKLFSLEGSKKAKEEFQDWLSRNQISSHMRVIARK